jgi:anthranilate synthase/aminodeoxychorismate synthase-like glutamine amidotransferase
MVLLLDNYDSFVHNLARYVRELGEQTVVRRNDAIGLDGIEALGPSHIIVSPGPCTPLEAGISNDAIRAFAARVPILGVCLGHQCIAHVFGARVVRAPRAMHGMASPILHDGRGLFAGLPNPFRAGRYHSLIVPAATLPRELEPSAWTAEGELMALRHRSLPVFGVQFHPESILTEHGYTLLRHFLALGARSEAA